MPGKQMDKILQLKINHMSTLYIYATVSTHTARRASPERVRARKNSRTSCSARKLPPAHRPQLRAGRGGQRRAPGRGTALGRAQARPCAAHPRAARRGRSASPRAARPPRHRRSRPLGHVLVGYETRVGSGSQVVECQYCRDEGVAEQRAVLDGGEAVGGSVR